MGRKGVYPKNFGTPHSRGTLINEVTIIFLLPMSLLMSYALGRIVGVIIVSILWIIWIYNHRYLF